MNGNVVKRIVIAIGEPASKNHSFVRLDAGRRVKPRAPARPARRPDTVVL